MAEMRDRSGETVTAGPETNGDMGRDIGLSEAGRRRRRLLVGGAMAPAIVTLGSLASRANAASLNCGERGNLQSATCRDSLGLPPLEGSKKPK